MSSELMIALPLIIGLGFMYWSSLLSDEEEILKLIFKLLFIPFCILSIHMASLFARLVYVSDSELVVLLADITLYLTWILLIIGVYYIYIILKKCYELWMSFKTSNASDKYD